MRQELAAHTLADIVDRVTDKSSAASPRSPQTGSTTAAPTVAAGYSRETIVTEGILVVGGGFAGFWAALAAKRVAGNRALVTLVSREPVLEMRPRLYEANPEQLGIDLRPLLEKAGVAFRQGEAAAIDVERRGVILSAGERIGFHRLVVATGSQMRRPPVSGAEAAFSIDTISEAMAFDRRLQEIAQAGGNPSIAIVGAGFTGI